MYTVCARLFIIRLVCSWNFSANLYNSIKSVQSGVPDLSHEILSRAQSTRTPPPADPCLPSLPAIKNYRYSTYVGNAGPPPMAHACWFFRFPLTPSSTRTYARTQLFNFGVKHHDIWIDCISMVQCIRSGVLEIWTCWSPFRKLTSSNWRSITSTYIYTYATCMRAYVTLCVRPFFWSLDCTTLCVS